MPAPPCARLLQDLTSPPPPPAPTLASQVSADVSGTHHHRGAPRPGAPRLGRGSRGYGYALHTNTDNAPPVQLFAGGCGTAVLGATRGTPPSPQPRLGLWAGCAQWDCAPQGGGGGGGLAKRPKRLRPPLAGETQAFKRGRVLSDLPPPAKRACVRLYDAARHGRAGTGDT